MTNVQELEVIVDDKLADAIRHNQETEAEIERATAARDAANEAAKQAQRDMDAAIERNTASEWRDLLDEHDGIGVVFDGTVYAPRIDDGEHFDVKRLRSSGKPSVIAVDAHYGQANGAAVKPHCDCKTVIRRFDSDRSLFIPPLSRVPQSSRQSTGHFPILSQTGRRLVAK